MTKEKKTDKSNETVDRFLLTLEKTSPKNGKIIRTLQKKMKKAKPGLIETIMYGGIVFKDGKNLLWGLFSTKNHVTVEFGNGSSLNDTHNALDGKGNKTGRRNIKIETIEDIKNKHLDDYIKESAAL